MLGMSAFKRKPRQFSYQPVYHDPNEENKKERERERLGEKNENYVPGSYIHHNRRNRILGIDRPQNNTLDKRRVLIRLMIFFILLIIVGFVIMKSDILFELVQLSGQ